jgi:integrase
MRGKNFKCKTPGIRFRKHATRKHGIKFDQYFYIRYRVDGRQKEEGLGWSSKGWSEVKAAALLAELKANQTSGNGPKTLQEKREVKLQEERALQSERQNQDAQKRLLERTILDNVFEEYQEANTHKKSLKDEINYYKNWIKPTLGNKHLEEIILLDLERIKRKMIKEGKAKRSIQYIKSIIRQTYNHAVAHKLYSGEIPTTNFLKNEHSDNRRQRYLSPIEAEELLNKVKEYSEKTYQISLTSLHTGMRFGEIASLMWQHVNTKNREIIVVDPKNSDTRSVFMTDRVLDMFESMEKGKPNELVFPSQRGTKRNRISKSFAASVNDLKFNEGITDRRLKIVFHSLRHSCASILVNAGVEIPVIAKILGHKTLAMTMRYSHINDKSVKNALAVLNEIPTEDKCSTTIIIPGQRQL